MHSKSFQENTSKFFLKLYAFTKYIFSDLVSLLSLWIRCTTLGFLLRMKEIALESHKIFQPVQSLTQTLFWETDTISISTLLRAFKELADQLITLWSTTRTVWAPILFKCSLGNCAMDMQDAPDQVCISHQSQDSRSDYYFSFDPCANLLCRARSWTCQSSFVRIGKISIKNVDHLS